MSEKIIQLIDVYKEYDKNVAVENVSFYVNKGEFVTFLGPSGCGKTTTLRMIAGFEMPTGGQILLNGKDVTNIPPHKRPINTVFQRYALFPHLDVYDNVAFGLKLKKVKITKKDKNGHTVEKFGKLSNVEIAQKVTDALKMVDLEGFEDRNITTLSGGQQQRVAIARAIVNEPEILLLDEPLGALDLKMRKEMQIELKELHRKLGMTFIYVTHDQEEALTMSDTVIVMKDGMIQQIGTPMDIYNEPKNVFVADFIGESNILSGLMVGKYKVKFLGHTFDCVDDFAQNEYVDVVVRPEDIKMTDAYDGMFNGIVISSIFKGMHYEMTVQVGKSELTIQSTYERKVGEMIGMNIKPSNIHIMKREFTSNVYDGYITKKNTVVFGDGEYDVDVTQLYPGSHLDEEGYLITKDGQQIDLTDVDVRVEVGIKDIDIEDINGEFADTPAAQGNIISIIYKGDHYQLIVRTEENEEDYVLDTEYLWNENDTVAISIPKDKIKLSLKPEAKK